MFEEFKAKRAAAQAAKTQQTALAKAQQELNDWQKQVDSVQALIATAQADGVAPDGLALHRGEQCFGTLTSCSLIEERKGQGHFVAGSAGVSIPIGKIAGRSIRYRVGTTRGHYVAGTPSPTAIATGTLSITDQRLAFLSTTQTRECRYDHLVGIQRDDDEGSFTASISNRQHPVTFSYGHDAAAWVAFHVELGMSHYRGDTDDLIKQLTDQLAEIQTQKPADPYPLGTAPRHDPPPSQPQNG